MITHLDPQDLRDVPSRPTDVARDAAEIQHMMAGFMGPDLLGGRMNTKNEVKRRLSRRPRGARLGSSLLRGVVPADDYRGGNQGAYAHHGNRWAEHLLSQRLREGML